MLAAVEDAPQQSLAFNLALNGLRTDEIVRVTRQDLERHQGLDLLTIPSAKRGKREVPLMGSVGDEMHYRHANTDLSKSGPLVDVSKRTLRNWIDTARKTLDVEGSENIGMHDLRRTWATDTYYTLAFEGIPIAEELVMSWGGWAHTANGRETFRRNYLGPVPYRVAKQATQSIETPTESL